MSQSPGAGQRTTDVDTAAYVVRDGEAGYYVEGLEGGTLLSNGEGGSRQDKQPLTVVPAREEAATLTKGSANPGVSEPGRRAEDDVNLVVEEPQTFDWQMSGGGKDESFRGSPATGGVGAEDEVAPTMGSQPNGSTRTPTVAYTKTHGAQDTDDPELWDEAGEARTLNGMGYATDVVVGKPSEPTVRAGAAVRRLTPSECELLQGFPPGWTAIDGDATPDGPRYAALGDAVTTAVAWWIVSRVRRKLELADG